MLRLHAPGEDGFTQPCQPAVLRLFGDDLWCHSQVGISSHAWYASTPIPWAFHASRLVGSNSSTFEVMRVPKVFHRIRERLRRSGPACERKWMLAEFGYQVGHSSARTRMRQIASRCGRDLNLVVHED